MEEIFIFKVYHCQLTQSKSSQETFKLFDFHLLNSYKQLSIILVHLASEIFSLRHLLLGRKISN